MKRKDTISLGEFRELTKDLPDETAILLVNPTGYETQAACPLHSYPFCTTLDNQGVFLLESDISDYVSFQDC